MTNLISGWTTASYVPNSTMWVAVSASTEFTDVQPSWQPMQPIRLLEQNAALAMTKIALPAGAVGRGSTSARSDAGADSTTAADNRGGLDANKSAGETAYVYVYEFAQNAAGTGVLSVSGCPAGTQLDLYYAEVLCGYGTNRWSPPCPKGTPPSGGVFGTVRVSSCWSCVYLSPSRL